MNSERERSARMILAAIEYGRLSAKETERRLNRMIDRELSGPLNQPINTDLIDLCSALILKLHGAEMPSGSVEALSDKMNGNAPLDIRLTEGCGDENVEAAVRCLKEMPAVTEILREEPYLLRIRLENDADVCPDVLRTLVMKGVPVCDFHRAPMNLEKVFMEVTGDA